MGFTRKDYRISAKVNGYRFRSYLFENADDMFDAYMDEKFEAAVFEIVEDFLRTANEDTAKVEYNAEFFKHGDWQWIPVVTQVTYVKVR